VLLITDMAESCEIVVLVLPAASNASPPSAGDVYMMPAVVYAYRVPQIGDASNRRHVCPPAARGPALRLPVCVCVCVCARARTHAQNAMLSVSQTDGIPSVLTSMHIHTHPPGSVGDSVGEGAEAQRSIAGARAHTHCDTV